MASSASPRAGKAGGSAQTLRLHPRVPPPWSVAPHKASSSLAGYPSFGASPRSRMSPRQVKLQHMEPATSYHATSAPPTYTLAVPLREQVATDFRHELLQFHQLLRDAVEASIYHQRLDARSARLARERGLFELLTSDRGDAVLKEFFAQWQQRLQQSQTADSMLSDASGEGEALWRVLETLFAHLPLVVPEREASSSAKSFLRYADSLHALRELLLALLFKSPSRELEQQSVGKAESGTDEGDVTLSLKSSIGLGFGLDFNGSSVVAAPSPSRLQSPRQHPEHVDKSSMARVPLFLHCQRLERELEALRRRVPNRRTRDQEAAALGITGLLEDTTMMLLLDFWALPPDERLAFFCQVASQAGEQDAGAILRVFLENCTTHTFLQVWDALQHSPQFQTVLRDAVQRQQELLAASVEAKAETSNTTADGEKQEPPVLDLTLELDAAPNDRRASQIDGSRRRTRRSTRFVDLNGIMEVFDERDDTGDDSDDSDDQRDSPRRRRKGESRDSPRFRKLVIRERGRLSLSNPSEGPAPSSYTIPRKERSRRKLRSPGTGGNNHARNVNKRDDNLPVLDRLHDDLTELIKLDSGVEAPIMDAVWQLLEVLDGHRMKDSRSGYHRRHQPLPPPAVAVRTLTPPRTPKQVLTPPRTPKQVNPDARSSLQTPLTPEQQFLMKLDQLQSMLVALGDVRVHAMSTETITAAYRRLPMLTKLFTAVSNASLGAAGAETSDGDGFSSLSVGGSTVQRRISGRLGVAKERHLLEPLPPAVVSGNQSHGVARLGKHTSAAAAAAAVTAVAMKGETMDEVREDVEAMGLLLVQFGKFVRSLAPFLEAEDAAGSANDDVLTVMDLADDLENAGALAEAPVDSTRNGGKRRLTLAVDREAPILLAVQSLARSNQFEDVSRLITTALEAKQARSRQAIADASQRSARATGARAGRSAGMSRARGEASDLDDDADMEDGVMDGDEDVLKMALNAKNLRRRVSVKTLQLQEGFQGQIANSSGAVAVPDAVTSVSDDGGGLAATSIRDSKRDIPMNIKHTATQRGLKLFSADILLRIISQLYRDNYEGVVPSLQYGSRRMEFSEFMYDWHIRKYGLKALAQRHLLKLIQSLRKHDKKVFQCELCLRFLGIQNPLGFHEHKFVLGLLERWSLGTFFGGSKNRVALSKRQFKIRISHAVTTVQEALRERFGVYARGAEPVAERIRALARPGDEEFARENDLLTLCVDEFVTQRALLEKVLEAVYLAGDLNGDGNLEFDEFASVVTHLAPTVPDRFLQKVFSAAHDFEKPPRISFERFLDAVLLERVLSPSPPWAVRTTHSAKNKAGASLVGGGNSSNGNGAAASAAGAVKATLQPDEQEEADQFELLRETWTTDRESVTQVLQSAISHAPTAKSLAFRVAFLDQLLARRVDAKTAWLCHRQIMREISRYQHLNADEIAGLQHKEQQFKKAVRAIRHAQRLSTLFVSASGDRSVSPRSDSDRGQTLPRPSYTTTVEKTLGLRLRLDVENDGKAEGEDQFGVEGVEMEVEVEAADVAALENELRETFLERADEGAIDDYMAAIQHLRRVSIRPPLLRVDQSRHLQGVEAVAETEVEVEPSDEIYEDEEDEEEDEEEEEDEQS